LNLHLEPLICYPIEALGAYPFLPLFP
jgi:hypothetical protein